MSSLIVTDVSLADNEYDTKKQVSEWILKRIFVIFDSLKRKYDALSQKTDKITRLYDELADNYSDITSEDYPGFGEKDSARKILESFFRKTDRFRISLIQLFLEQNESRLLEQRIIDETNRLLSQCVSDGYFTKENPRYIDMQKRLQDFSEKPPADRLTLLKKILSDISVLYYTGQHEKKVVQKRIDVLNNIASSLQLRPVSLPDLESIQHLIGEISEIGQLPDLSLLKKTLSKIEAEFSAIAHRISGIEHIDMSDLDEKDDGLSEDELKDIKKETDHVIAMIEAVFFHDRIGFFDYDNTESLDYEPVTTNISAEELTLQRENLQLEYGLLKEKIPEKTVIREQLEEMIQNLSLEPDAGSLLDSALLLYHEPFPEMREMVLIRRQYDAYYLQKAEKTLSGEAWEKILILLLNYLQDREYHVPTRIPSSRNDFFRRSFLEVISPVQHYSLLISINPLEELVFRLVRIVDGMDVDGFDSEDIMRKDTEASDRWGHDYDIISKSMQESNIVFIERLRKNPDEISVQQLTRFDLLTDEHIS